MTEVKTSILSCVYLVLGMTLHSGIFNLFVSKALFYFVFLQSMLLLAPKLSEKTINNQLLKYFAKLQMDQEVLAVYVSCCSSVVMEWFSLDCMWDIVKTSHIVSRRYSVKKCSVKKCSFKLTLFAQKIIAPE